MYFGQYPRFAFQCVIDWDVSKQTSYLFGHSCFWVNGTMLGDFCDSNILAVTAASFENFLDDRGQRSPHSLVGQSSSEILSRVFEATYSEDVEKTEQQPRNDFLEVSSQRHTFWHCKLLSGWGEQFDSAPPTVLLEEHDCQRLIWCDSKTDGSQTIKNVQEVRLLPGEFERVVQRFLEWYKIADKERTPRFGQGEAGGFQIP